MEELVWHIPPEAAYDRLEDLEEFIDNFPDSPLVPCFQKEIAHLKDLLLID